MTRDEFKDIIRDEDTLSAQVLPLWTPGEPVIFVAQVLTVNPHQPDEAYYTWDDEFGEWSVVVTDTSPDFCNRVRTLFNDYSPVPPVEMFIESET